MKNMKNQSADNHINDKLQYVLIIISYVFFLASTSSLYPEIFALIFPALSIMSAIVGVYINYTSTKKIGFNLAYIYLIFSSVVGILGR